MPTTPSSTEVASARPSSTVVLVRDAAPAPEFFMVRRHGDAAFGGNYAFPGGVIEPADSTVTGRCVGITSESANVALGLREGAIDYYSAGIRELFEETGVLLAKELRGQPDLDTARARLSAGDIGWDRFVEEHALELDCSALHYFSFWVTPVFFDRRYSTRFFVAALPPDQQASHCGSELTDSCWMTAKAVLAAGNEGSMRIPPPTRRTLEQMADLASVQSMLDWANTRLSEGVPRIFPTIVERADGSREIRYPDRD